MGFFKKLIDFFSAPNKSSSAMLEIKSILRNKTRDEKGRYLAGRPSIKEPEAKQSKKVKKKLPTTKKNKKKARE